MKTRTLLVDSSYLIKRSFHGAKDLYTNSFGHIGCLYQFFMTIRKQIKDHSITKVILFFDGELGGRARHLLSADYKATRKNKEWSILIEMSDAEIRREKDKDESILKQRKRIQQYAEELHMRQLEVKEVEADDLIASYCLRNHEIEEIYLFTNDRDFSQLLDLNLTILFSNIDAPITKTNYMMYFDHHYSNALTLKIICGDSADNIKGVEGLKEKTLLQHVPELSYRYVTVKEICQRADEINKTRVANKQKPLKALENLINSIDKLKLNFQLVNLREPMLNDEAREVLEQLAMPLAPEGRSSKNLLKLMQEDEFLSVYGSTFVQYIEPFYTVIMSEKELYNEYKRKINK